MAVLIKVGALAMQLDLARAFVGALREISEKCPVVIFPGGGAFADVIRTLDRQNNLGADCAHDLAIRAMDSLGWFMGCTCTGVVPTDDVGEIRSLLQRPLHREGLPEIPLWLPHAWFFHTDPTPHSWDVTSDSLAMFAGAHLRVEWVGLAKITNQLGPHLPFSESPRLKASDLEELMSRSQSIVPGEDWAIDAYLPQAIRATHVKCRIFDGRDTFLLKSLLVGQENSKYAEILP